MRQSPTAPKTEPPDEQDYSGFYVDITVCMACAVCHEMVPSLFAAKKRDSFVHTQPKTQADLADMHEAINSCCIDAIKYGGTDPDIIRRLLAETCIPRRNIPNAAEE